MLLKLLVISQALISNPIAGGVAPPGYVYADGRSFSTYHFEIGFRLDPAKFQPGQAYSCNTGYAPEGFFLFDRHPNTNQYGRWMISIGGNQRLCFMDQPSWNGTIRRNDARDIEFDVSLGTCHTLIADKYPDGSFVVTLDGVSKTNRQVWSGGTYRAGSNGIGVGREVNGWHSADNYDSFPGDIFHVNDNGRILTWSEGTVTGNASIGTSVCEGAPPPPPPEPTTACDLDPASFACACETNNWPECSSCLAP